MSRTNTLRSLLLICFVAFGYRVQGAEPISLDVLYIGQLGNERAEAFERFLQQHFRSVHVAQITELDSTKFGDIDVVLLDWSQSAAVLGVPKATSSPLGARDKWSLPTVLVDSAGLLLAMRWDLIGGAG